MLITLENKLKQNELIVNVTKTKCVIFSKKKRHGSMPVFKMNGVNLDIVNEYKYLGCILNNNLTESSELKRITKSFNNSVGMFLRKFATVELSIKLRLFTSLCMSLYGLELITDTKGCSDVLSKLSVSYHYALKRILGFPKRFSNHYTCNYLDMLIFKHLRNYRTLKFLRWLNSSNSPCLVWHKVMLGRCSRYASYVRDVYRREYNVLDVLDNDFGATQGTSDNG